MKPQYSHIIYTLPSMNFHKLARLMYKPDNLQPRTPHYKGPHRGRGSPTNETL